MKSKNKGFDIKMYECGIDKFHTLTTPQGQTAIVVNKVVNEEMTTLRVYPFKFSKWRLINMIKFAWIRIKLSFSLI